MINELTIKKRSLKNNRVNFNRYQEEKELRESISLEEFRDKLLDCVAKHYENLQS
jgi:hypothetical protein